MDGKAVQKVCVAWCDCVCVCAMQYEHMHWLRMCVSPLRTLQLVWKSGVTKTTLSLMLFAGRQFNTVGVKEQKEVKRSGCFLYDLRLSDHALKVLT